MAGFDNDVVYGTNVDFTGTSPVSGQINLNGELLVGATVAPFIRAYVPTGSNGLVVNTGAGTLDFSLASIPNTALQNSSINVIAGSGLSGGGLVSLGGSVSLSATGGGTVTNVSGTANQVAVATGTTTPVISLIGPYTPATYTAHGVLIGEGTSSITALATGSAGQVLQSGGASADPAYSTPTYPSGSGTSRKIIVSDGTNNVYSTETYAVPGTSGNVMTSDGTNWTSSAVIGPGGLTAISLTLTNTQIKNLHGTPVQAIAAPGAGKVIIVVSTTGKLIYGGTNVFTAGSAQNVNLYYGTTTAIIRLLANASIVSAASVYDIGQVFSNQLTIAIASLENTAVNIYVSSATEISGNAANNNTMSFSILYYTISI